MTCAPVGMSALDTVHAFWVSLAMKLMSMITRLARSPQGRRYAQQAMAYARSPAGKRKVERVRKQLAARVASRRAERLRTAR